MWVETGVINWQAISDSLNLLAFCHEGNSNGDITEKTDRKGYVGTEGVQRNDMYHFVEYVWDQRKENHMWSLLNSIKHFL